MRSFVIVALFVAAIGIKPASFIWWYQPEIQKEH
ncbi:MAG: cyclic lactone autoinducer peptide [Bacillota bacterium]